MNKAAAFPCALKKGFHLRQGYGGQVGGRVGRSMNRAPPFGTGL
jgi:hypothetical protein